MDFTYLQSEETEPVPSVKQHHWKPFAVPTSASACNSNLQSVTCGAWTTSTSPLSSSRHTCIRWHGNSGYRGFTHREVARCTRSCIGIAYNKVDSLGCALVVMDGGSLESKLGIISDIALRESTLQRNTPKLTYHLPFTNLMVISFRLQLGCHTKAH
jgi:hypothetical protein